MARRAMIGEPNEATLAAEEMERVYGTDWAEQLVAAGKTDRDLYVEMLTAYYEAVDAKAGNNPRPIDWAGCAYLLRNQPSTSPGNKR